MPMPWVQRPEVSHRYNASGYRMLLRGGYKKLSNQRTGYASTVVINVPATIELANVNNVYDDG